MFIFLVNAVKHEYYLCSKNTMISKEFIIIKDYKEDNDYRGDKLQIQTIIEII